MNPPTISMSVGGQSLHIYLPDGELRAYDIPATFRAQSGDFHGEVTTTLDGINDLNSLHASLRELDRIAGSVREYEHEELWSPDLTTVFLTLTLFRRGRLRVEVELQDAQGHAELHVSLDADQSYLPGWIQAVGDVVERIHLIL